MEKQGEEYWTFKYPPGSSRVVASDESSNAIAARRVEPTKIPRILLGLWQLSGSHGYRPSQDEAAASMKRHILEGFHAWDLADIYGFSEYVVGRVCEELRNEGREDLLSKSLFFTKWVPDVGPMNSTIVSQAVQRSLTKMKTESIDLMQFHWWDYMDNRYLEALNHLQYSVNEGKIKHLGLTNFDTAHLKYVIDYGIQVETNQVQFSLVDQRPLQKLVPYCVENNIKILAYGTVCGGFFSKKYLGTPEPELKDLNTASLRKYFNMIRAWGGWDLFQELLQCADKIAEKHHVSIANVATRWVLQQDGVGSVILGSRLGLTEHIEENKVYFSFHLDDADLTSLKNICSKANDLFKIIGDCGDEYRESHSHTTSSYRT